jgi:hypothetical protein
LSDLSIADYNNGSVTNTNIDRVYGVTGGVYERVVFAANNIGLNGKYLDAVFHVEGETLEGVSCGDGFFGFLCKPFEYSTEDVLMTVALDHYWALAYYFENYDIDVVNLTLTTDTLDEYGNKHEVTLYTMTFTRGTFEQINDKGFYSLLESKGLEALADIDDAIIIYPQ